MHWSILEIKIMQEELFFELSRVADETKRWEIKEDLKSLKTMLSQLKRKKDRFFPVAPITDRQRIEKNISFVKSYTPSLINSLYFLENFDCLPRYPFKSTKVNFLTQKKLLLTFFESINLDEFYSKMLENNRIEVARKKYFITDAIGLTIPILSSELPFIFTAFDKKLKTSTIIAHEIGHAYQSINCTNLDQEQICLNSVTTEVFAKFLEYLMIDFLKKTEFCDQAYLLEKNKLDSFIASYEQFNCGNYYSSGKRLIANSLMFHFINAYRHNPTFKLIKEYNNVFLKGEDIKYISAIPISEISTSVFETYESFLTNCPRKK